jgi:uroporphyrinogen III methyltransferase/synthase
MPEDFSSKTLTFHPSRIILVNTLDVLNSPGIIYLIGAGPGDPGLITAKGLARLRQADAIVADAVAQAQLLAEANPEAEQYDVGSLRRGYKMAQTQVTQLLLTLARQGKTVARLWEGDPFVFGFAAAELAAAKQAGLAVEVVPGVTSAIAVPAYAGVPVTHWDYAAGFAVVSGFVPPDALARPDWSALARLDTLIILMPLENLAEIVDNLLTAGRPADTPTLIIQNGTRPSQKQVAATLGALVETAQAHRLENPALIVVGPITGLAESLAWFDQGEAYPLAGQRVLVTRPVHQAAEFMVALRRLGAEPVLFPTIEIAPVEDTGPLDEALRVLVKTRRGEEAKTRDDEETRRRGSEEAEARPTASSLPRVLDSAGYDWLVLTSANGVTAFWERLEAAGLDSRALAGVKIAAIGPATAAAMRRRSLIPDLLPEVYTAEGILAAFDRLGSLAGQRFLLARADIARQALTDGLRQRGAIVDEIASYRTVPVSGGSLPPTAEIVTFTSSSTVQGYVNCLGGRNPAEFLRHSRVVCIGPITAATARELGVPVSAVAQEYNIAGLLAVLSEVN